MAKVFKSVTHIIEIAESFMDKTDLVLCQLLLANSRLSYRELADTLDLSVTAVHNRIQNLVESGIIRKFTAKLGPSLNAIHVLIFGSSRIYPGRELNAKLQQHGSIYWLAIGGGNFLYVGAYLRNISELESLVSYIKKEAGMPEPIVGLTYSVAPFPVVRSVDDSIIYALDYQIIRSLKHNSRKATSDVAEELGVSAKTVRRRLSRMIKNGLIELSIDWYPDASNDIFTVFHVQTKPETDKNAVDNVFKKYSPNLIFYWGFSNIPNTLVAFVWTSTMKELQNIRENLEHEASVQATTPNILYTGYIFNCWRDQIPEK
jgi:DNA-binding Lrp family transcriptional regulator